MARPAKAGLGYFPKDVDFYEDLKIMDLMINHGPVGVAIYEVVLTMIYREGYFLEFKDYEQLEKILPVKVIKTIGNRWIKSKNFVLQVILYCTDIGLFHKDLLMQGVITSVGVQKRYDVITVRNKVQKIKYRLIDENGQPLLNAPQNNNNVAEIGVNVAEIGVNVAEMQQKKSKENKSKEKKNIAAYFENVELNNAFCLYLSCRENNNDKVSGQQIALLIEQLEMLSDNDAERTAIVKKATMSNWKSFYPLKNKRSGKNEGSKPMERNYDFKTLEQQLNKI